MLSSQAMGDGKSDAQRTVALREAAINATLSHPNIVATYAHDMLPLNSQDSTSSPGGCSDWQLFIIQVWTVCLDFVVSCQNFYHVHFHSY